jgi:F-type H+-transporting ATPase subunit a
MIAQDFKLKRRVALLLFPAVFAGLAGNSVFAQEAKPRLAPATSPNAAVKSNHGENGAPPAVGLESKGHGLTQEAPAIARFFGLPITNSMVVTWITALGLIVFARIATHRMKQVPDGAQNVWEWLVEGLYNFLESIIGRHLVERTFWFFASIFIFILVANWVGLIPGFGTIGWGRQTAQGFRIDEPLFRGANADLNLTLAMALVFFACWFIWANQELGPLGCLKELFGPKGESAGLMRVVMGIMFFLVGCLNIISILFRPISLSFRLYGNIFAGENMLDTMAELVPGLGWLLPIPFYFMELLVGFVQAMVFMLLTAVFVLLACPQEEKTPAAG